MATTLRSVKRAKPSLGARTFTGAMGSVTGANFLEMEQLQDL
jgi:hypothetical protein